MNNLLKFVRQKVVPFHFPNKLHNADDYDDKVHSQFSWVVKHTDDTG